MTRSGSRDGSPGYLPIGDSSWPLSSRGSAGERGSLSIENELSVDLLTDLPRGEDFEKLWKGRTFVEYQDIKLTVISKRDLRRILKKVGRKQDVEDLEYLKGP